METISVFKYKAEQDGSVTLIETTTEQIETISTEDLITQKEQQLLQMYNELQALKDASSNQ